MKVHLLPRIAHESECAASVPSNIALSTRLARLSIVDFCSNILYDRLESSTLARYFYMTPDFVKRLSYSKYLLGRAKSLQQAGNELSSAEAALAAHDSAEMLMRVITDNLGASPAREFMDFWKIVKEKMGVEPPHKGAMDRLNNLRVGFKHKGNLPNPSVVGDLMPSVAAFCKEITEQYLGLDYETVSLTDLIHNREAHEKVKEGEKAAAEGNFPGAMLALGIAFDRLDDEAHKKHSLGLIQQSYWDRLDHVHVGERYDPELAATLSLDKLRKSVQQVIDRVNMLILGIEPERLRRFSDATPVRNYAASGNMEVIWLRDPKTLGAEDFDFCHQFVIEFALRLASST